jgi:hypothetical protein
LPAHGSQYTLARNRRVKYPIATFSYLPPFFSSKDWLSNDREGQPAMDRDWMDPVEPNESAWGIPPAAMQELNTRCQAAENTLVVAKNKTTRTPVATAQCKKAFEALMSKGPGIFETNTLTGIRRRWHGGRRKDTRRLPVPPDRKWRCLSGSLRKPAISTGNEVVGPSLSGRDLNGGIVVFTFG